VKQQFKLCIQMHEILLHLLICLINKVYNLGA
jgi:hypothetical protein